jgi:hypothetical protein
MSEEHRKIKKIEVGKMTHDDTAGQKSLYIRIHFTSKLARESSFPALAQRIFWILSIA